jgi:serine/threonine protein kinase
MCGTPEYLASEILLSKNGHDKTVDYWSFGSLIYEMLVGGLPHYNHDKKAMFRDNCYKQIPYPKTLTRKAISLLNGLLVVDPRKCLGYGLEDAKAIKKHEYFYKH